MGEPSWGRVPVLLERRRGASLRDGCFPSPAPPDFAAGGAAGGAGLSAGMRVHTGLAAFVYGVPSDADKTQRAGERRRGGTPPRLRCGVRRLAALSGSLSQSRAHSGALSGEPHGDAHSGRRPLTGLFLNSCPFFFRKK